MTENVDAQIPQEIKKLIEEIPENGAIEVDTWEPFNPTDEDSIYYIAKINGRLEFIIAPKTSPDQWTTHYVWDYEAHPEEWNEHFEVYALPKIVAIQRGVFI